MRRKLLSLLRGWEKVISSGSGCLHAWWLANNSRLMPYFPEWKSSRRS